jgi:hypothetical protein
MTPIVLIHGGGFDSRCWDLLVPLLDAPALAVDLPGRVRHPAPLSTVSLEACADAVVEDVDAAGYDDVVLGNDLDEEQVAWCVERQSGSDDARRLGRPRCGPLIGGHTSTVADQGGDPACWADRVCPECGQFVGDDETHACPEPADKSED